MCVFAYFFWFAFGWKATHRWYETQENSMSSHPFGILRHCNLCVCMHVSQWKESVGRTASMTHKTCEHKTKKNTRGRGACVTMKRHKTYKRKGKSSSGVRTACMCQNENWGEESAGQFNSWHMKHKTWKAKKNTMAELCVVYVCVCVCACATSVYRWGRRSRWMYKLASNQYCCSWTLTTLLSPQQHDTPLLWDAAQRQFPSSSSLPRTSDLSGAFVPSSTSFPP